MRIRIAKRPFGTLADGTEVFEYTLKNERGSVVKILTYGAILHALLVRDRKGEFRDVVLGYDTLDEYVKSHDYLGVIVGRCASRIAGASFTLNGKTYHLGKNEGENSLHGGVRGFDRYVWDAEEAPGGTPLHPREGDDPAFRRYDVRNAKGDLVLTRVSKDGEEGYPGNLRVSVAYTLTDDDVLKITYDAVSDQDTIVNLTSHGYFNLDGGDSVLKHQLRVSADGFVEIDKAWIPSGKILPVEGTPFDFRAGKEIGADLDADYEQLKVVGGYDHNFILNSRNAAELYSPESGIMMEVHTDLPSLLFFSSNFFGTKTGKDGKPLLQHCAACLETQTYPDAIHHPEFPSNVLRAGEPLHTETKFLFGIR